MNLVPSDRENPSLPSSLEKPSALPGRDAVWWVAALFIAWSIAWLAGDSLRDALRWGDTLDTAFWVAVKFLIWVVPAIVVLRRKSLPVADYVGLRTSSHITTPLKGLAIGSLAGLVLLAFSYAMDAVLGGASFNIPVLDAALFYGVIVAPIVEEFTMRGFYLESLERSGLPFMQANTRQALVFVALQIPGWYFQGRLRSPLSVMQPAIFLWLLALLLGWIKKQSGSLYAPMMVHVLNNLYSAARG